MKTSCTGVAALFLLLASGGATAVAQGGPPPGAMRSGTTRVTILPAARPKAEKPNTYEIYQTGNAPLVSRVGSGAPAASTPVFHTVRKGDTLWGLCDTYFRNPWRWPRVWALNPSITNPHWIYPGDRIRLRKGEASRSPAPTVTAYSPKQTLPGTIYLKQRGFIAEEELKHAAKIVGSREEKIMLATYDSVYIKYPHDKPLKVGQRYDIYRKLKEVIHPVTKRRVGHMVEILGQVEINQLSKANVARGTIRNAVNPIERGDLVGLLKRKFDAVRPIKNTRTKVKGTVIAVLDNTNLIGTKQLIFIDRGKKYRVKVGYTFYVTRRGDAYQDINTFEQRTPPSERKWPRQVVASVVVVDVGWTYSVGYVSNAIKEIRLGDTVELMVDKPTR